MTIRSNIAHEDAAAQTSLPATFRAWFTSKGWRPYPHQMALTEAAGQGVHALLIAPTGAGKTLAGFLPSLISLSERPREGLHTLYLSPLKALAVDIQRNLETPVAELRLPIRTETRTGDTPPRKRERQIAKPPHLLMTTPESLALMLANPGAGRMFAGLSCVVVDELHALAPGKRGDLLALGLARLARLAPAARRVGLSATVADPALLAAFLSTGGVAPAPDVRVVFGEAGAAPALEVLASRERVPWAGHMALHAMGEVYRRICDHRTTLVFVNTRAQAELVFQELWRRNTDTLPIALHHGSLAVEQRRKVEAAMAAGRLRAVVATSSLDLGVDWAAVDLVVQIGAPKGASRMVQRIGRANHRLDVPSRGLMVPANRFEILECRAAQEAIADRTLDSEPVRPGGLDVLAQHILGMACAAPFHPEALFAEVTTAFPYAGLTRRDFDDTVAFVATGGYALGSYERFRRLVALPDGRLTVAGPAVARQYRLNVGTIVQEPLLKVRLNRGPVLGEVEEYFIQGLVPGDTFVFAGRLLKFVGLRETEAIAAPGGVGDPKVPAYAGARMPLTTHLAARVREILADPARWRALPEPVGEWLALQRVRSVLPEPDGLLVESFPRGGKHFLIAYCFEGRNAHQTLGMLLTRRMERAGLAPLGFVATDYVLAVWSLRPAVAVDLLFDQDMLGDDLEAWMAESSLLRRTFRNVAVIAGLIDRRHPGLEKSGRQITFSSDLIYDVLRKHEPAHVLLRATRADAATGLTDVSRLAAMLARVRGRITHQILDRISPLAVPVLAEIGREAVYGTAMDELLEQTAQALADEALGPSGSDDPAR